MYQQRSFQPLREHQSSSFGGECKALEQVQLVFLVLLCKSQHVFVRLSHDDLHLEVYQVHHF